ncbi:L,D-transpeptidase, partial [Limosilactobacillus equigenerosi]
TLNQYWFAPSENKPYPNVNDVNRIVVDLRGNRTYLYNGNNLLYTMNSTGGQYVNGRSLTPTGTFYIQSERGNSFYNRSLGEGANYWTSFLNHGVYLFHSIPTGRDGNYIPSEAAKLGKTQGSHGCIRLSVPDAKYMMGMRVGTKVEIFG